MLRLLLALWLASTARAVFDGENLDGSLTIELDATFCQRWFHEGGGRSCNAPKDGAVGTLFASDNAGNVAQNLISQIGDETAILVVRPDEATNLQGSGSCLAKEVMAGADVAGIIVLDYGNDPEAWSPTATTVQGEGTPFSEMMEDPDLEWNPDAFGLIMAALDLPVVVLNDQHTQAEVVALAKRNVDEPSGVRNTARIDAYFGPEDVLASDCLMWKNIEGDAAPKCQPIGGQSVKAHMGAHRGSDEMVFALISMDIQGFVQSQSYAAAGVAAQLAAYLAAADALSGLDLEALEHQIGWLAWQGESWGFLGSHRMVWDQKRGCENVVAAEDAPFGYEMCTDPMWSSTALMNQSWSDSVAFISLDQVGAAYDGKLWVHKQDVVDDWTYELVLGAPVADLNVEVAGSTVDGWGFPPSGISEYKAVYGQVSSAIITGYDREFNNDFYGSRFDRPGLATVSTGTIADAATLFARSLYMAAGANSTLAAEVSVNTTLVEELYECLTTSWACDFMREYIESEMANQEEYLGASLSIRVDEPPVYYASVYSASQTRQPVVWRGDGSATALIEEEDAPFDKDAGDKFVLVPNALEIFVRSFLAEKCARAEADQFGACETSADCPDDVVGGAMCMRGACIRTNAFYQNAFSAGIRATDTPGVFEAIDLDAPMAAEPNWDELTLTVYPAASTSVAYTSLVFGMLVAAAAGVGTWKMTGLMLVAPSP